MRDHYPNEIRVPCEHQVERLAHVGPEVDGQVVGQDHVVEEPDLDRFHLAGDGHRSSLCSMVWDQNSAELYRTPPSAVISLPVIHSASSDASQTAA
jgi:hypothetical protein